MTKRSLDVEDLAVDLAVLIHQMTARFPPEHRYELARDLRRSAVSVGSNIAEGRGRKTGTEFARSLDIALGSARELEFQLRVANRLGFGTPEHRKQVNDLLNRIVAMCLSPRRHATAR
ncbi:MAG: four helix bundle protein [Acidimicrobiia bacterium]